MPSYHAKLSPSSAHRWTSCTASIDAQEGIENTNSDASRQGTCCHQIQAECLLDATVDLQTYLGRKMVFWSHPESSSSGEDWSDLYTDAAALETNVTGEVTVTQEMLDAVASAIAFVRKVLELRGGTLFVEQSVPIGQFTGEDGATGSTDIGIFGDDWACIFDSKYGRNKVHAYEVLTPAHTDIVTNEPVPEKVRGNLQMCCYALGLLHMHDLMGSVKHVTLGIIQPFVNHVSEYSCSIEELREVEEYLRAKAEETRTNPQFCPTPDNCHFCRASGNCAAQDKAVMEQALIGFDDVTTAQPKQVRDIDLGTKYALVPMVQDWCKAIEARTMEALRAGLPVSRSDGLSYKLVVGKKGDRSWVSDEEAIATMKGMRLQQDQMFKQVLLVPAAIEKLTKVPKTKKGEPAKEPVLSALRWTRLQKLITQADGKPVIALETDPRPAVAAATDGFEDVPPVDNTDLF